MFAAYSSALTQAGRAEPCLVLDLDMLDQNIAQLKQTVKKPSLRLVVKSLPSLPLLRYLSEQLGTQRFMSFHWPFALQVLNAIPNADILLGKPLPERAISHLIEHIQQNPAVSLTQLHFLVDSKARLVKMLSVANDFQVTLNINLEVNVGMCRGGVDSPQALMELEAIINANSSRLTLTGLMGYDAHAAKAPQVFKSVSSEIDKVNQRYQRFINALVGEYDDLVFNGAGSPTHTHQANSIINDISVGSVLVKPSDFELPALASYRPALFIATPVLKRLSGVRMPLLAPWLNNFINLVHGKSARDTLFIYGGRWMAKPVFPVTMAENSLYGLSSNQQMMTIAQDETIDIDDWVYFQPTQSEAVMLQFGDILGVRSTGNTTQVAETFNVLKQR